MGEVSVEHVHQAVAHQPEGIGALSHDNTPDRPSSRQLLEEEDVIDAIEGARVGDLEAEEDPNGGGGREERDAIAMVHRHRSSLAYEVPVMKSAVARSVLEQQGARSDDEGRVLARDSRRLEDELAHLRAANNVLGAPQQRDGRHARRVTPASLELQPPPNSFKATG